MTRSNTSYSDPRFGQIRRIVFPNVDAIGTAAVHPDEISVSHKSQVVKFGVIGQDNTVRASSDTILELISGAATVATWVFTAAVDIAAADVASGLTLTTPLALAANAVIQGNVGVIGSASNFQWYVDVQDVYENA